MRTARLAALAVALGCGFAACHRPPSDSPEFRQAFDLYNELYAAKLDDAYGDPQMARVQALLRVVAPGSEQAGEAKDLLVKVELGLAEYRARQARLSADERAGEKPARWTGSADQIESPLPPPASQLAGPSLGMTHDDFLSKFASCFDLKGLYQTADGKRGEAYALRADCAVRYPALTGSLVVLLGGRVAQLVALADVRTIAVDAGPPEEAVAPPPKAAPPPAPPPPRVVRWMPGAPHP